MTIEVHADILCPWCYIFKRRLEAALAMIEDVARPPIVWRAFELAPDQPRTPGATAAEAILEWRSAREGAAHVERIRRLGAEEGLALDLNLARPVNTFDAHRLVHLAAAGGRADAMVETLLHAYHVEGANVADAGILADLGAAAGLDRAEIAATLDTDAFAEAVRRDEALAQARGVTGVPTLVIAGGEPIPGIRPARDLARLIAARA